MTSLWYTTKVHCSQKLQVFSLIDCNAILHTDWWIISLREQFCETLTTKPPPHRHPTPETIQSKQEVRGIASQTATMYRNEKVNFSIKETVKVTRPLHLIDDVIWKDFYSGVSMPKLYEFSISQPHTHGSKVILKVLRVYNWTKPADTQSDKSWDQTKAMYFF